ncbi:hypothetical protein S-PM2d240 [Synechococcus phage S-PM2]|uniref:Hypothetical-Protein / belonging to T4-LIKE GC: 817 n=1 Tax=Synechococcus phage S-PM2 TaxID=238854 RepID=D8FRN0_BPSYP|nr:Hypothetical-Protein / belonging to T4-LIKE GC: 817 [Synechococcus phage S-PM2]CBR26937.1 Hypothetical-Protein / belonging to T4-LIKE GC: 817 [Synechococcus phage S-PM2]CFW42193.1 hypothetical protein S-PM2d240 [Synechococcus phage S-PM2]
MPPFCPYNDFSSNDQDHDQSRDDRQSDGRLHRPAQCHDGKVCRQPPGIRRGSLVPLPRR